MRFLNDDDYNVQIRTEISKLLDPTTEKSKLLKAEIMAIAQIRNHLAGRYDCEKIFTPVADGATDSRDQYIVMLTIDLALYHLWSKEGGNNIPKTRELRYNDALEWLKNIQNGKNADLPELLDDTGAELGDIMIWSKSTPENNRY